MWLVKDASDPQFIALKLMLFHPTHMDIGVGMPVL